MKKFISLRMKLNSGEYMAANTLKVYDTDAGKIGILICYDVEFPELSRLLAEQGMQIFICAIFN